MAASTKVVIVSTGASYTLPGTDWTAASVVSNFSETIPGIGAMDSEVATDSDGNKTITFRPKTGNKG
jgi:hypothetical protein